MVAFKYGIAEHLPSVPYSTFTDDFLMWQICLVFLFIMECLVAFRLALSLETGMSRRGRAWWS